MKKAIIILLAFALMLSTTACGGSGGSKKAFEASKAAYENVDSAYTVVEQFGDDIYEAWRMGIYDDDESDFGLAYLAKNLNLSQQELEAGAAHFLYEDEWDSLSESEQKEKSSQGEAIFTLLQYSVESVFSLCVNIVTHAYIVSGKTDEIKSLLDTAKGQMRDLSEKYSDYEHYPALKGFYTTTSSFFDFCTNPTGSFEQVKTTVDDYRNKARDYKSDLSYIFD